MKKISNIVKVISVATVSAFSSVVAFAQDTFQSVTQVAAHGVDTDIIISDIENSPFYAQLWFWVVIGIVFLLLLIALIRGTGRKKDKVTDKKEVNKKVVIKQEVNVDEKEEVNVIVKPKKE